MKTYQTIAGFCLVALLSACDGGGGGGSANSEVERLQRVSQSQNATGGSANPIQTNIIDLIIDKEKYIGQYVQISCNKVWDITPSIVGCGDSKQQIIIQTKYMTKEDRRFILTTCVSLRDLCKGIVRGKVITNYQGVSLENVNFYNLVR